jgi:hypothetical protein
LSKKENPLTKNTIYLFTPIYIKKRARYRKKGRRGKGYRTDLRDKEETGVILFGVLDLRCDRERCKILVSEAGVVALLEPFLFGSVDIFPGRVFSLLAL